MKLIQFILICALLILLRLYLQNFKRSGLRFRILLTVFFLVGIAFVVFPDTTTQLAQFLGVGRGTDLLLYVSIIGAYVAFLWLYAQIRRIQEALNEVVRELAIRNPQRFPVQSPVERPARKEENKMEDDGNATAPVSE